MPAARQDDLQPLAARLAGTLLLIGCVLLLGRFGVLVAQDRSAVTALLVVFALVTVPALGSAALGLRAGVALLLHAQAERGAAVYSALVTLGQAGAVLLSLEPGADRRLSSGDLAGAGTGAVGLVCSLAALALLARGRSVGVRLTAAAAAAVLVLGLLAVRAVTATR